MQITNRPLVSVIVSTYNYGHFLEDALDSIFAQTLQSSYIETIVIDDGSTDDTAERMLKYKGRAMYIYQENSGQACALNKGFAKARGEIIAFLDSDDYFAPNKLFVAVNLFRKFDKLDIFYHNLAVVDENRNFVRPLYSYIPHSAPEEVDRHRYFKGHVSIFPPTSGIIFRKTCLDKIMPMPDHYDICADTHLHFFGHLYADHLLFIPDQIGYYRMHGGNNFSNGDEINKHEKLIRIYSIVRDDLNNFGIRSNEDVAGLVKRLAIIIEYWKINLKMLTLPGNQWALWTVYLLRKMWFVFQRVLKSSRIRRFYIYLKYLVRGTIIKYF